MPVSQRLVAGVDSSTQSCKVVVCDADTGEIVRSARAPHPDGTEVHPDRWWEAWLEATGGGILDGVSAVAVAGQQHGMVTLDEFDEVVRPALLWNDTRYAPDAEALLGELGGAAAWAAQVGVVPVAAVTVTKLGWLARCEPETAARVRRCVLPHDWLTGAAMTYDVDHQNILYVLGADGQIKWLDDAAPDVRGSKLPDRLAAFLDAQGLKNVAAPDGPSWTPADLEQAIAYVVGSPVHPASS